MLLFKLPQTFLYLWLNTQGYLYVFLLSQPSRILQSTDICHALNSIGVFGNFCSVTPTSGEKPPFQGL